MNTLQNLYFQYFNSAKDTNCTKTRVRMSNTSFLKTALTSFRHFFVYDDTRYIVITQLTVILLLNSFFLALFHSSTYLGVHCMLHMFVQKKNCSKVNLTIRQNTFSSLLTAQRNSRLSLIVLTCIQKNYMRHRLITI